MGRQVFNRSSSNARAILDDVAAGRAKARVDFLHSGSSVLNLALSGNVNGGWGRGRIANIVGDGSSGKTILALECAAWCYYNIMATKSKLWPKVKRVKIVYYNAEEVMDFPLEEMYGDDFVASIDWRPKEGKVTSAEGFGRDVGRELNAYKKGDFVLYIEDSIDSLIPEEATKRFDKAAKEDKPEESHSYAETASYFSQSFFKNLVKKQKGKDFTILLISQVREKIGVVFGKKHYRTGGKSLDFYTHQVAWLAVKQKLYKTIAGDRHHYGIQTRMKLERSKVSKPYGEATFDVLFNIKGGASYGVDDYGSLVNFIKPKAHANTKDAMVRKLERDTDYLVKLRRDAQRIWDKRTTSVGPVRQPKYR